MSERDEAKYRPHNHVSILDVVGIGIAIIAVVVAIGAVVTAQRAGESADMAERWAELAIERQRQMAGTDGAPDRRDDPRSDFLASTANRRELLADGLEQWGAFYARYEYSPAEIQYRAFTDFFDAYPMVSQYFFFVTREEIRRGGELSLNPSDRASYETFRYWQDLRISMSP